MESRLIYINKTDLYKELDELSSGEFFAVADSAIKNHLPKWIQFSATVFWLNNPEEQKVLATYEDATEFFLKQGIHRESTLYVFGGGATTDFGGFIAATLLRGIKWRAIPTTLLAMVDGSLGGKVALNTPSGKNLIGAFHHPEQIYLCPEFLNTLDKEHTQSGRGEILKYGFLSPEIGELILKKADIGKIIEASARFKMGVVERDFRDKGERAFLNLGHTLGHAFEFLLKLPHGLAVAMGMKYLFEVMKKESSSKAWTQMAESLELPMGKLDVKTFPDFDKKKFFDYLQQDKKRTKDKIKLVLSDGPGKVYTEELSLTEFKNRINAHDDFADK